MMNIDLVNSWMSGDRVVGVSFYLNDSVQIEAGPNRGEVGAVISLNEIDTEPIYTIELSSGADVVVNQTSLRKIED